MTLEISQIGCLNSFFNDKDKQNYLLNYFALEKGKKGKELERIINCVEEKTGIRLTKSFISKRFFDEKKKNLPKIEVKYEKKSIQSQNETNEGVFEFYEDAEMTNYMKGFKGIKFNSLKDFDGKETEESEKEILHTIMNEKVGKTRGKKIKESITHRLPFVDGEKTQRTIWNFLFFFLNSQKKFC